MLANDVKVVTESRSDINGGLRIIFTCNRQFNDLIVLLPACIAAEQTRKRVVDLFAGRCGDAIEKIGDNQSCSWIVITRLHHANINHCLLNQT
ncbi:Uncharacterised protein [Shigella sonnei]|nr:Uncharacterised protein [Shigella sonnei]CSI22570.1 Uncharacterised protein [Shigella sonnei]